MKVKKEYLIISKKPIPQNDSRLEMMRTLKILDRLDVDDDLPEVEFSIEDYLKIDCSYLKYGPYTPIDKGYTCNECDSSQNQIICETCYKICHKDCRKTQDDKAKLDKTTNNIWFTCYCGEKQKHMRCKWESESSLKHCSMAAFESKINNKTLFYCPSHKINICTICFLECHVNCLGKAKSQLDNTHSCQCTNSNHSEYNEIALSTLNIQKYQILIEPTLHIKDKWPIQILNLLFGSEDMFGKLVSFMIDIMNMGTEGPISQFESPFSRIIGKLTELFNKKFNTFYYHPEIERIFSYESICLFMKNIVTATTSQKLLRCRVVFIILYVHLKKDFQIMKSLTTYDFICLPIIQRLIHKQSLLSHNIYTNHIYEKYKLSGSSSLQSFVLNDIWIFMGKTAKTLQTFEQFRQEYLLGLKCLRFILKRMLFNKFELKKLIESLYDFQLAYLNCIENEIISLKTISSLFCSLVKVYLLIGVNYNDLTVHEELLKNKVNKHSLKYNDYIHSKSDHGRLLLKIIIKSCKLFRQHYNKQNTSIVFSDKIIFLFDQSLNLFSITENFYSKQIKKIEEGDVSDFFNKQKQQRNCKTDIYNPLYILKHNIEDIFYQYFNCFSYDKDIGKTIELLIMKETAKIDYTFINSIINKDEIESNSSRTCSPSNKSSSKTHDYIIGVGCDETHEYQQMQDYQNLLISFNSKSIPFIKEKRLPISKLCETIVNAWIDSNIDETILKSLIFLSRKACKNQLSDSLLDICLHYLSLFFLIKPGLLYFISGKNIIRINKLFHSFQCKKKMHEDNKVINNEHDENILHTKKLIDFIYLMCKGIECYHLSINDHKGLKELSINLLHHIEDYYINHQDNSKQFMIHLTLITNIIYMLSPIISHVSLTHIKKRMIQLFDHPDINFFKNNKTVHLVTMKQISIISNKKTHKRNRSEHSSTLLLRENKTFNSDHFHEIESAIANPSAKEKINILEEYNNCSYIMYENLYVAFFDLVTMNTYFVYDDDHESIKFLPQNYICFNTLELYRTYLSFMNFSLKMRRSLLNYLRTFFFIDIIDKTDITKQSHQLTTEEFIENEEKEIHQEKLLSLKKLLIIIDIFVQEIEIIQDKVLDQTQDDIMKYIHDIILSFKFISDFFLKEKKIWNKASLSFYKLTKCFVEKCDTIKFIYNKSKTKSVIRPNYSYTKSISPENFALLREMINSNFDIVNNDEIYHIASTVFSSFLQSTSMENNFSFQSILKSLHLQTSADFTPLSLIKEKNYILFYEDEIKGIRHFNIINKKIELIRTHYTKAFIHIHNTNFLEIIKGMSNEADQVDYCKEIFDYFITYLENSSEEEYLSHKFIAILCIVTKILFYDTKATQDTLRFLLLGSYLTFFMKLHRILKMQYILIVVSSRNIFIPDAFISVSILTKLLLKFILLLGEGFNKTFNSKILGDDKKPIFEEDTFYKSFMVTLIQVSKIAYIEQINKYELPYDKLILVTSKLVDILIEYMGVVKAHEKIVNHGMNLLLTHGFFNLLFVATDKYPTETSTKVVVSLKVKLIELLIAFFQSGNKKKEIRQYLKVLSSSVLYDQILFHFQILLKEIKLELISQYNEKKFVSTLLVYYVYDTNFNLNINLQLCLQLFILIKIYEDLYGIYTLSNVMNKIQKQQLKEDKPIKLSNGFYTVNSLFAYKVRKFLEQLILKVEITCIKTDDETLDTNQSNEVNLETFFIRPSITFNLSEQTKVSFEMNVDRSSKSSKLQSLLFFSDYFIFEMAANTHILGKSSFYQMIKNIKMKRIEVISYLILIIQNILMIITHYKPVNLSNEDYGEFNPIELYSFQKHILIIAIVHLIFLFLILLLWFYYKYPLYLEKYILLKNTTNFVFRKEIDNGNKKISKELTHFFNGNYSNRNLISTIITLHKDVSFFLILYNAIFDSLFFNREICTLFYTMIFIIIYLSTKCIIWLSIPLLLIMNLNETLTTVFSSVMNHFSQLFSILILTYIIAYIFMWISLHYMNQLFNLEVYDKVTETNIQEQFCTSSLPCLLTIIDYFIMNYSTITSMVSFKQNFGFYLTNFFYNWFFFIIISLVMINVFLGVLYDTFGELRIRSQYKENDIKNVCFICQMTRDRSLTKNINFDKHVKDRHSMWNYVCFLIYLHINNPSSFNGNENYVWDKLGQKDISWIPHDQYADEQSDDEE